ncbi:MAG: Re/Si-specific NAD(P)(+) transhydrogenase subunit alpha [Colwellia sp.]|nr:Re/Si-specific NAD(P)(+) transhydrogenase subunit alpha [Colwellia sp.]
MKIGVFNQSNIKEKRVALVPSNVSKLIKKGFQVQIVANAGLISGYPDDEYSQAGATICEHNESMIATSDILLMINAKPDAIEPYKKIAKGKIIIGMMDPLMNAEYFSSIEDSGLTTLALELVPRITRAQSMDVLSSMATIAGNKGVILGASKSPKLFPLMMTAAGTVKPSRVFIMGVGVAGLQACATAKRLGAVVEAYDIRPAAREQILSVGAKPVELDIEAEDTETKGGYAKEQSAEFIAKQQAAMGSVLSQQDVVITTAAIPGRKAPILITAEMVKQMKPGAVIVDLASETGGNCELTKSGETVVEHGVTIIGDNDLPASAAYHASQMYGTNLQNLLSLLIDDEAQFNLDLSDDIIKDIVLTNNGELINERLKGLLDSNNN